MTMRTSSSLFLLLGFGLAFHGQARDLDVTDIDGKTHRPFAQTNGAGTVMIFIGVECPIANYYHPTLRKLMASEMAKGISFYFFHGDPDTTLEAATKHRKDFEIVAPVFLDPNLKVARRVQAEVTPEAFLFKPDGSLVYRGKIDDMYVAFGKKRRFPKEKYLEQAIKNLKAGKAVEPNKTKAIGCYIHVKDLQTGDQKP